MSKGLVETITDLFKPQAPLWACELSARHAIVTGIASNRSRVTAGAAAPLPLAPPKEASTTGQVEGLDAARPFVRKLLADAGFKGSEIAVVVPDGTARIAFLTAENWSSNPAEQRTFIRWRLKKSVPFDVETAQVAYRILGAHRSGAGVDVLVALSPRSVVQEYERLFEETDIHAGMVLPSTLAALNLFTAPAGDTLFVKVAPDCITTTVFQNRRVQFYRRVTDVTVYDAVYPTLLYYQDKLGGKAFEHLFVCGYGPDLGPSLKEIENKLGLTAERMDPKGVDDMYKPALGAVHLRIL